MESFLTSDVRETADETFTSYRFAVTSSTPKPDDDDVIKLVWIIPTVLGVIAVLFILALGLFYCIRALELAFIRHCAPACTCCACCVDQKQYSDEYIHLNETFDIYQEKYSLNGSGSYS